MKSSVYLETLSVMDFDFVVFVGTKSMQKQHQHEEPRSSGNEYTNSLVVKITAHFTSP